MRLQRGIYDVMFLVPEHLYIDSSKQKVHKPSLIAELIVMGRLKRKSNQLCQTYVNDSSHVTNFRRHKPFLEEHSYQKIFFFFGTQ